MIDKQAFITQFVATWMAQETLRKIALMSKGGWEKSEMSDPDRHLCEDALDMAEAAWLSVHEQQSKDTP